MKKIIILPVVFSFMMSTLYAQLNYSFSSTTGTYAYLSTGATTIHPASTDDALSSAITLPFTFNYNCQPYTQIKVSTNGWLTFDMSLTTSNAFNNLDNTPGLIIAPLWDDLDTGSDGCVRYSTLGSAPNRVFTIEWYNMLWNYLANGPVISFQVKLYETTNRIEFIYSQEADDVNSGSASIGLNGSGSPLPFLSLNSTGASPSASSTTETDNLSIKPATDQIYRWDPITCSGMPSGYALNISTPSNTCSPYTATLNVTGTADCGITYNFQSAPTASGPWTSFNNSTNASTTFNVTGLTYFRVVVTCTNSGLSMTTNTVSANLNPICVCDLIQIPALPYSSGAQTTCGKGNDVTSSNVTNVCGSSSYYTGEDAVYSFTPTATGQITITLNSSGSYTGLMLYKGCPSSGGLCVSTAQSSTGSKTLTCVNVQAGQVYYLVIDSWAAPSCNPYDLSISSISIVNTASVCNMNYSAASTTYSFETFTGTSLPMTDDVLFNSIVMFGFSTCWDGGVYWGGYPASNSSFVFDAVCNIPNIQSSIIAAPGVSTGWSITSPAPVFGTSIPRNAILGPWHDINPASSATVATSRIQYATFGTAPNRRTVISWEDIPYYSSSCESSVLPLFSGQIKIFEDGNIEIHIKDKQVCSSWNGGAAVLGLHNYDGTIYIPPVNMTAHNYPTQWTMTNTAYRFTPQGSCASGCVVLPIGFKSFYGERIQKVNHLYWETAEESNLNNFEVLRSTDGIHFEKIGNVHPNNAPSKYHFEDHTAPLGKVSYYKIRSIENNGQQSETQIYAIDAAMDEVFVTGIFPNPANDEINVMIESRLTNTEGKAQVNAYDVFGKQVLSKEIKLLGGVNTYKMDIQSLNNGVYVFEILVNDREKVVEKIIKE